MQRNYDIFYNLLETLPTIGDISLPNRNEIPIMETYEECISLSECTILILKHHLVHNRNDILVDEERKKYIYDKLFQYALLRSRDQYQDDLEDSIHMNKKGTNAETGITHEEYTKEYWLKNVKYVDDGYNDEDRNTMKGCYGGNSSYDMNGVANIALKEIFRLLA